MAPCRVIAPVRARTASSTVVLPLAKGPTSAMHRGPATLPSPFSIRLASLDFLTRNPPQRGGPRPAVSRAALEHHLIVTKTAAAGKAAAAFRGLPCQVRTPAFTCAACAGSEVAAPTAPRIAATIAGRGPNSLATKVFLGMAKNLP